MKLLLNITTAALLCSCGKHPQDPDTIAVNSILEPSPPPVHLVRWMNTTNTVPYAPTDVTALPQNGDFRIQSGLRDDGVVVWRTQK
jgi:hypothetical protein